MTNTCELIAPERLIELAAGRHDAAVLWDNDTGAQPREFTDGLFVHAQSKRACAAKVVMDAIDTRGNHLIEWHYRVAGPRDTSGG